ncbi:ArnT family glycosyltransferase [candidate division KSB1 bacterium]
MTKKRKSIRKKEHKKDTFSMHELLFIAVYLILSFYFISQLYNQPLLSYLKPLRVPWIIIFWIFIGLLGISLFRPLAFLNNKRIIIAGIFLTACGLFFRMNGSLFFGGDSGLYLVLSRSIAEFKGYVHVHMPNPTPHTGYGFGLPLLVAPAMLFGIHIGFAKFIIVLTGIGFTIFTFLVFKKYIGQEFALLIAILSTYNWWNLYYSSYIMTEIPFAFFVMMGFYFFDKYAKDDSPAWGKYLFITAGVVYYAYVIKPVGLGLLASFALYLLIFTRNWKKVLLFSGIVLAGVVAWNVYQYYSTGSTGYAGAFLQIMTREGVVRGREMSRGFGTFGNILYKPLIVAFQSYKIFVPMLFSSIMETKTYLYIVLTIVMFYGFIRNFVKHRSVIEITLAGFFLGIVITNYLIEPNRYYMSFIPFIYFYLFVGLKSIIAKLFTFRGNTGSEKSVRLLLVSFVMLLFIMHMVMANRLIESEHPGREYAAEFFQDYYDAAIWMKENLPEDSIQASRLDKEMYLLSGLKGVNSRLYFYYDNQWTPEIAGQMIERLKQVIIENDIDYFVLDSTRPDQAMTRRTLIQTPGILNEVFISQPVYMSSNQSTVVWQINEEWKTQNRQD